MQKVSLPQLQSSADLRKNNSLNIRKGMTVLLSWEAAERIWKPKTRVWYLSYALLILTLIFIAARMGYYIVIVALAAFMLLWFVQGTIAPWILKHKLTSKGVYTNGYLINWEELQHFWFAQKGDQLLLYLDFKKSKGEPRATLLVPEGLDYEIFSICSEYLPYGNINDVEYNIFSKLIYGTYLPLSKYITDLDDVAAVDKNTY